MRRWSRHHLIFERREYCSPDEKAFRNHRGLVVPLKNEFHYDTFETGLHNNVLPPVKPETAHILGALVFLDTCRLRILENPLELIPRLADYFERHEEPMADNLRQQLNPYIREGWVRGAIP